VTRYRYCWRHAPKVASAEQNARRLANKLSNYPGSQRLQGLWEDARAELMGVRRNVAQCSECQAREE